MNLENLRKKWVKSVNYDEQITRDLWNVRAENFGMKDIVSFEDNDFLQLIADRISLTNDISTLDIGCGTGIYSLALAPFVREVFGCDVADRMIGIAQKKAAESDIRNARFLCFDWETADIDSLGFNKQFDVVLAHMTPAVNDFTTIDNMVSCAKKHCFMRKPFRRQDSVLDETMKILRLPQKNEENDELMENIFSFLWHKGFEPYFSYKHTVMQQEKTIEDALAWSIGWAKMQREIKPEEEREVRQFLTDIADGNGLIHEKIQTTLVTIDWRI